MQMLWVIQLLAEIIAGSILGLLVWKFLKRRPCWLFNHEMRHLSIEKRYWLPDGKCLRCDPNFISSYRHDLHSDGIHLTPCYITKWICDKCGAMGFFCAGDERLGAWKIEHGRLVPDEKAWAQWSSSGGGKA